MQERSGFVTAVGWTFLFLGVFKLGFCALQAAFMGLAPAAQWARGLGAFSASQPAWARAYQSAAPALFALACAWALLSVAAAVGLLGRREWARKLMLLLLAVGMLRALAGLCLQVILFTQTPMVQFETPGLRFALAGIGMLALLLSALFIFLYSFVLYGLTLPQVQQEFLNRE